MPLNDFQNGLVGLVGYWVLKQSRRIIFIPHAVNDPNLIRHSHNAYFSPYQDHHLLASDEKLALDSYPTRHDPRE